jgi:hypothetical protein
MIRPVGNGVIGGATLCPPREKLPRLANRSYRTLRDGLLDGTFQAINCLATIISVPPGQKLSSLFKLTLMGLRPRLS